MPRASIQHSLFGMECGAPRQLTANTRMPFGFSCAHAQMTTYNQMLYTTMASSVLSLTGEQREERGERAAPLARQQEATAAACVYM